FHAVSTLARSWSSTGRRRLPDIRTCGLFLCQRTLFHRRCDRTLEGAAAAPVACKYAFGERSPGFVARFGRRSALCAQTAASVVAVVAVGSQQSVWRAVFQHGAHLRARYVSSW